MSKFIPAVGFTAVVNETIRPQRRAAAEKVVVGARRSNTDDTGHYDRSLHTFDDQRGVGAQTDDIAGHIIEYGSIRQEPQAPMRTGASAAGRFEAK